MSAYPQILNRFDHEWQTISGPALADYGDLGTLTGFEAYARLSESGSGRDTLYYQAVLDARTKPAVERLLLQLFKPRAIQMTKTCQNLIHLKQSEGYDAAISFSINCVWQAIRTLPETATHNVPTQIAYRALQHVTRSYHFDKQTISTDPQEINFNQDQGAFSTEEMSTDLAEVMNVLQWAIDSSVLTQMDARLLGQYTVATEPERQALAEELEMTRAVLSRKLYRIKERLSRGLARQRIERGALA